MSESIERNRYLRLANEENMSRDELYELAQARRFRINDLEAERKLSKEMLDRISEFIETEKKKFYDKYYEFKSDVFKEIGKKDPDYEKAANLAVQRCDEFQENLFKLFKIDDKHLNIMYLIPNRAIQEATAFSGVNPSNVVRDAIEALILVKQLCLYSKIEIFPEKNSMNLIE